MHDDRKPSTEENLEERWFRKLLCSYVILKLTEQACSGKKI
jgi:hypothetical protein